MANQLDQIVDVQIARVDTPISRTGFGTPMILGTHKVFDERVRTYYDLDSMIADGFKTTDLEYIGAESYFSQNPRVESVEVGRRAVDDITIEVDTAIDSTTYSCTYNGELFQVDSGTSSTTTSIATALVDVLHAGEIDYSNDSFDLSVSSGTDPVGFVFNDDGSKMFTIAPAVTQVDAYDLGTNFDITTGVYNGEFVVIFDQVVEAIDLAFSTDGSKMFVLNFNTGTDKVFAYDLSTNFDVSTAVYNAEEFGVVAGAATPRAISFSTSGLSMFLMSAAPGAVFEYSLSTAFDVSTATYGGLSLSISAQVTDGTGMTFNNDGTRLYVTDKSIGRVYEYELPTPFYLATAVYKDGLYNVSAQDGSPSTVAVNTDESELVILGDTADTLYAYDFIPAGAIPVVDNLHGTYSFVASVPGTAYSVVVDGNQTILPLVASDTITNDIVAVRAVSDDWYALTETGYVEADVLELAAYIETTRKLYFTTSTDTNIIDQTAIADTTSIAAQIKALDYDRTIVNYHESPTKFECGWLGVCLPTDPGSITWAFKTIKGVVPSTLNTNQVNNALSKNCNVYNTVAGRNITREGKVSSGEWIDIMRGSDWLHARIQENIFTLLVNSPKVPYTDGGITAINSYLKATLTLAVNENFLSEYTTAVPKINEIDPNDKINRVLKGVTFVGILSGAIQKVEIRGQLTPDGSLITQIV